MTAFVNKFSMDMHQTNIKSDDPPGCYAPGPNLLSTASEGIVDGVGGYRGLRPIFLLTENYFSVNRK
jgi:hypothetical protein